MLLYYLTPQLSFQLFFDLLCQVSKRRRLDVIPSVSSAAVTGGESLADLTLLRSHIPITPAEQIRSFEELLDNLDRIEVHLFMKTYYEYS